MSAYYNEIDPYAAQWLRNLIAAGHIALGDVDERSIEDVTPADLMGYTQCHFFAGIGVWSYALRQAGISDDTPVWTGSCPCQPFSTAGQGKGFADERHLWPYFHYLIEQCRPPTVLGEQVASGAASAWIDLVHADLESLGYAFGCVPFPSAGIGAPHIRDRAYWVANSELSERWARDRRGTVINGKARGRNESANRVGERGDVEGLGNAVGSRQQECECECRVPGDAPGRVKGKTVKRASIHLGGMADTNSAGFGTRSERLPAVGHGPTVGADSRVSQVDDPGRGTIELERPGPTNGAWSDVDWLRCRDGKWWPVEPGSFPLANGAPSRVGRLRAYGNAINAIQAQIFIEAVMECI